MNDKANIGDTVQFHYTGTLEDGSQFDSSRGDDPMQVTLGSGAIIPALEAALVGMAPGETRSVTLPPEDAYGERDERLVQKVEVERIPEVERLQVGTVLQAQVEETEQSIQLMVTAIDDKAVTLDANHPLAGRELTFDVEMVSVSGGSP